MIPSAEFQYFNRALESGSESLALNKAEGQLSEAVCPGVSHFTSLRISLPSEIAVLAQGNTHRVGADSRQGGLARNC